MVNDRGKRKPAKGGRDSGRQPYKPAETDRSKFKAQRRPEQAARSADKLPRKPVKTEQADDRDELRLVGRNAVMEALNTDKPIDKIFFKKGEVEGTLKVIAAKAREKGIVIQEVDKAKLELIADTFKHQGVAALCPAHEYAEVSDILQRAADKGEPPFILILDGVTDPHNLGAIIRTAEVAGVHGVIIPKRRAVGLTTVVSKASAGALAHMPIARVANLTRVIDELKAAGLWVACADIGGTSLYEADLTGALALVIGSEGSGVGRLVREQCDFRVTIPMFGQISSLNASVAAGILLYEAVRKRRFV